MGVIRAPWEVPGEQEKAQEATITNVKQEEIITEESVTNIDSTAKEEKNKPEIIEELDNNDEEKKDSVDNEVI